MGIMEKLSALFTEEVNKATEDPVTEPQEETPLQNEMEENFSHEDLKELQTLLQKLVTQNEEKETEILQLKSKLNEQFKVQPTPKDKAEKPAQLEEPYDIVNDAKSYVENENSMTSRYLKDLGLYNEGSKK